MNTMNMLENNKVCILAKSVLTVLWYLYSISPPQYPPSLKIWLHFEAMSSFKVKKNLEHVNQSEYLLSYLISDI